eukprot:4715180-Prymnesium_polylepis.1
MPTQKQAAPDPDPHQKQGITPQPTSGGAPRVLPTEQNQPDAIRTTHLRAAASEAAQRHTHASAPRPKKGER